MTRHNLQHHQEKLCQTAAMSPEVRLLVILARYPFGPDDCAAANALLETTLNFTKFMHLLSFHRLQVHVARNLNTAWKPNLPHGIRLQLARRAAYAEQKTREQITGMRDVLSAFSDAGIDTMILKGPATAMRLYGDPWRRVLYDIDIMTRPQDTGHAVRILEAMGFTQVKPALGPDFSDADIVRLQNWSSNIGFVNPADPTTLFELHWRPGRYQCEFPLDKNAIWSAAEPISLAGQTVYALNPVQEALFLCVHGYKHDWKRLHWLLDIAALSSDEAFDWDAAIDFADTIGLAPITAFGATLAGRVFASPVPSACKAVITTCRTIPSMCNGVIARRYTNTPKNDNSLEEVLVEWRNAGLLRDGKGRIGILFSHFFPGPEDWQTIRLPRWLNGAYYLIRILRIVVQTTRAGLKMLRS